MLRVSTLEPSGIDFACHIHELLVLTPADRTVRNDLLPRPLSKGILDGQLLNQFALQPIGRQKEMMRQIGTDAVTVASDLQALGGFW